MTKKKKKMEDNFISGPCIHKRMKLCVLVVINKSDITFFYFFFSGAMLTKRPKKIIASKHNQKENLFSDFSQHNFALCMQSFNWSM